MVPFPDSQFQVALLAVLLGNLAAGYAVEKACQRLE